MYFHAVAGNANNIPRALMNQARVILHPFSRFLQQAINTAKQRQIRYKLPWEKVREQYTIRVETIDSVLRVPRREPPVVLTDWPDGKQPDLSQPGFVPARGDIVRFHSAIPSINGLLVRTEPALRPTDRVLWCTIDSAIRVEPAPAPPCSVTDGKGNILALVADPQVTEDGQSWELIIEGNLGDCSLVVDGEEVDALAYPQSESLRRVVDSGMRSFAVNNGVLRSDELPAEGLLKGDNGLRYQWRQEGGRRGCWVQLLPPNSCETDNEVDAFLDPRAAFCEGNADEVWTQEHRNPETSFHVKKTDQDRYQLLLDRYPPEGSKLLLPVDLRNLLLQRKAIRQLREAPLLHHQGLLRLCEDPSKARWPEVCPVDVPMDEWRELTNDSFDGTDEQRRFVSKALGSPDFAFLEGPPGSGKTTAICEIIQQLVAKGQRVLLCASTHVAIDNVIECLEKPDSHIYAVRIGKIDRVDDRVQHTQIEERVRSLVERWRALPAMSDFGDNELKLMAERTVVMAANLTCGTTMGIVNHPLFRERDNKDFCITKMPHWDVLIVDEASKTLTQEFLVPALMAKRWIIVGDVRQLPPFTERADIVANLRNIVDESNKPAFPPEHQRARLLLFRMKRKALRQPRMRWLFVEQPQVIGWIAHEILAEGDPDVSIVRVSRYGDRPNERIKVVTAEQLRDGKPEALYVAASDWVLVDTNIIDDVACYLPANLLIAEDLAEANRPLAEGNMLLFRQSWWLERAGSLPSPYRDRSFAFKSKVEQVETFEDAQCCERGWLSTHDLAQELAWRVTRHHELRRSHNDKERERLRREIEQLTPSDDCIRDRFAEIEDIGLPSVIEVIQEGIGVIRALRRSSFTAGMQKTQPRVFGERFERLTYQHRMHADIASFPREVIYACQALRDANTIQSRDLRLAWDFYPLDSGSARRLWVDVEGREHGGVNDDEIRAMARVLEKFIQWAKRKGPPDRALPKIWQVACLCFYVKQEGAISEMLRQLTKDDRKTRFEVPKAPVEVMCGTVDRFQGREADLVMLSMRNTRRVGFLDSPNRLNVAVTRGRQQLVIFGNAAYFARCGVSELEALANRTQIAPKPQRRTIEVCR